MAPAPQRDPDLRQLCFEYTSRGDRVPGRVLLPPAGKGPFPLVVLQHGARGSKEAPYMLPVGGPWARAGAAVLSIDFPLHGERASAKMGALLRGALGLEVDAGESGRRVLAEFFQQAVIDLRRALDAAQDLPMLDTGRVAYAGLSLGSMVGATFCALDSRPCAVALALGGGGFDDSGLDPIAQVGRISPRPLLFVNARNDETVPRARAEALHAAAGEPKQVLWFDAGHGDLPGQALKAIWTFLRRHLGLATSA
jgi:fermentation-respiration switch protein FrsA (DUF1100 family)